MVENMPTESASIVLQRPVLDEVTAKNRTAADCVQHRPVPLASYFVGAEGDERAVNCDGPENFEDAVDRYRDLSKDTEYEDEDDAGPNESERKLMQTLVSAHGHKRPQLPQATSFPLTLTPCLNRPQSRLPTSFWLGDEVIGNGIEWFSSQLPTWQFSFEESHPFLAEYSHLAAPILEELLKHGVLEEKGSDFTMTRFGVSLRRAWNEMKGNAIRLQFPRTYVWPYQDDYVSDTPLDMLVATWLSQETAFHTAVTGALEDRHGKMHTLDTAGYLYFIRKALLLWCDGMDTFLSDELLAQILSFAPPKFLAMLQRSRNGCPVYPGLRAVPAQPPRPAGPFVRYMREKKLPDDWSLM